MRKLYSAAVVSSLFLGGILSAQSFSDNVDTNIVEREASEKARKSGFGDLEVDNLHGSIAARLKRLIELGNIPEFQIADEGANRRVAEHELFEESVTRDLIQGRDSQGRTFYRLRMREGYSSTMSVFPVQFIFRSHCYLYPAATANQHQEQPQSQPAPANPAPGTPAGNPPAANPPASGQPAAGLDRIIFQFYRINYSGSHYVRELRRFIHPRPLDVAQAGTKPIGSAMELLSNNELQLEYYEEPSNVAPVWEGVDMVPLPVLPIQPRQNVVLNDPKDPIPYSKQVKILDQYKKLLRRINAQLATMIRTRLLERNIMVNKVMDFSN